MKLKVLGSSSAGNCYLLDNGIEALMIECGISFDIVKKATSFDISRICGVLISHEHGDHSKEVKRVLDAQLKVITSNGTAEALGIRGNRLVHAMRPFSRLRIGSFDIMPFPTQHDAAEPFGYLINHPETGTVLFATDTYYLKYKFSGLNNILLECNYRIDILERNIAAGLIPNALRNRTIKSHCSFDTCKEILVANDLSRVNNIVLIHLSAGNSNAVEFKKQIAASTGKTVHVAEPGLSMDFNKTPF